MRVFVLTGAGISAESGLEVIRNPGSGSWAPMPGSAEEDPDGSGRMHARYDARRRAVLRARPNAAHLALARLEAGLSAGGGELVLVTQNVDDLHERAGSRGVIHMHGELLRARCTLCGCDVDWPTDLGSADRCPCCHTVGGLRTDVVRFGEPAMGMQEIMDGLERCQVFASIGTSGLVEPASTFVRKALARHMRTVEINLVPSAIARRFRKVIYGPATQTVPKWVDGILEEA